MTNKTYEVVIEETLTYVIILEANNKGFAQIKAKAEAAKLCAGPRANLVVKSVNEKELTS